MDSRASKVKFDDSPDVEEGDYVAAYLDRGTIIANLGFLQRENIYRITILATSLLGKDLRDIDPKNENVTLVESSPDTKKKVHKLVVELRVKPEMELAEKVTLVNNERTTFTLLLLAQVLEPNQGRAALKKGVHCIYRQRSLPPGSPDSGRK